MACTKDELIVRLNNFISRVSHADGDVRVDPDVREGGRPGEFTGGAVGCRPGRRVVDSR